MYQRCNEIFLHSLFPRGISSLEHMSGTVYVLLNMAFLQTGHTPPRVGFVSGQEAIGHMYPDVTFILLHYSYSQWKTGLVRFSTELCLAVEMTAPPESVE